MVGVGSGLRVGFRLVLVDIADQYAPASLQIWMSADSPGDLTVFCVRYVAAVALR